MVLKDWAKEVLTDYGLTWADVFGASSDAGPGVKSVFCNVLKMVGTAGYIFIAILLDRW